MTWQLRLPLRDFDEPLDARALDELPQALGDGDEERVTRSLLLSAWIDHGCKTVGDVKTLLAMATPERRRELLDLARESAGLKTATRIDFEQQFARDQANARVRAAATSPYQVCAADGCGAVPVNEVGAPIPTDVRRWWCEAHRDQAAPGDTQPRPPRIRLTDCGVLVEHDADEEERARVAEKSRQRIRELREAERAAEAEELHALEEARRAKHRRELPPEFTT